jgi:hypothetical protein
MRKANNRTWYLECEVLSHITHLWVGMPQSTWGRVMCWGHKRLCCTPRRPDCLWETFSLVGTWASSSRVKRPGRGAHSSPTSNTETKNVAAKLSLFHTSSWHRCNYREAILHLLFLIKHLCLQNINSLLSLIHTHYQHWTSSGVSKLSDETAVFLSVRV